MQLINPVSETVQRKVSTVMKIIEGLNPFLFQEVGHAAREMDKEVKLSAEATFINCCNRLDNLLADFGDALETDREKVFKQIGKATLDAEKERAAALRESRRPAVIYRPHISRTDAGQWCATYGDLRQPETCVVGVGNSPEDAMLDFDREFNTKVGRRKKKK
jgi:hypothetical protein